MDAYLQQKIEELKAKNLFRSPKVVQGTDFLNFSSNDYLGLRNHPKVIEAAVSAIKKYGAGSSASRYAGGEYELIAEFEEKIAAFKGYEAACVFGSGYLANIGVIPALAGKGDEVLADKLSHACIIDGIKLSGAKLARFKHNDIADLKKRITPQTKLIVSEEIFSMDGDKAPEIKADTHIMLDGAHSLYEKSKPKCAIYVGTMSKALGAYGGYVCGSKTFIEYIKTSARSVIYSTALPPAVIASAIAALEIAGKEKPYLKTLENARYLCSLLDKPYLGSAIIPLILGEEEKALAAEKYLRGQKILVSAIRPPTVPKGSARLRITLTAQHDKEQIELLAEHLKKIT